MLMVLQQLVELRTTFLATAAKGIREPCSEAVIQYTLYAVAGRRPAKLRFATPFTVYVMTFCLIISFVDARRYEDEGKAPQYTTAVARSTVCTANERVVLFTPTIMMLEMFVATAGSSSSDALYNCVGAVLGCALGMVDGCALGWACGWCDGIEVG